MTNKTAPVLYGRNTEKGFELYAGEKDKLALFVEGFDNGTEFEVEIRKRTNQRTAAQNRALHKFFEQLAVWLNDAGLPVRKVLAAMREGVDIEWDKDKIKSLIWREFQKAVLGKESTTELEKQGDIDAVYNTLNRFFAERLKTEIPPFPSIETTQLNEK